MLSFMNSDDLPILNSDIRITAWVDFAKLRIALVPVLHSVLIIIHIYVLSSVYDNSSIVS